MNIISFGKASKANRVVDDLKENVVGEHAQDPFPTMQARMEWMDSQYENIATESSITLDLASGTHSGTELVQQEVRLKKVSG